MSEAGHTHVVEFIPNPVQRQFIESRAKADLFSSRMGEGKSTAIAWAVYYHTRHNPGANWAIIRDTWENLRATTMKTFFDWFPPGVFGTFNHSRKTFTWAEGVAKGTVEFLGMDDPQDASKLMSRELGGFAIDEPAPAVGSAGVDEMIFNIGLTRLRQPGMKWYGAKLAENNPDESHWTYRRFVNPGDPDFRIWQPVNPENERNLPDNYYENMRRTLASRPDLVRRFVEGEFGFQQEGKAVTPQWNDKLHLAIGLIPIPRRELILLWDFGHNPTCVITQKTPLGHWNVLDSLVGENIGVEELIEAGVVPLLQERYRGFPLRHIGDPAGNQREQTSIDRTAVKAIRARIGGNWRSGPSNWDDRIEPLRAVLARNVDGRGIVQVDRTRAKDVWYALRGGWRFHVARTGLVSGLPVKDKHSHPGDAMSYGAAILFPMGRLIQKDGYTQPTEASYFKRGPIGVGGGFQIGPSRGIFEVPKHGQALPKT